MAKLIAKSPFGQMPSAECDEAATHLRRRARPGRRAPFCKGDLRQQRMARQRSRPSLRDQRLQSTHREGARSWAIKTAVASTRAPHRCSGRSDAARWHEVASAVTDAK
jgi:hypothetical protein